MTASRSDGASATTDTTNTTSKAARTRERRTPGTRPLALVLPHLEPPHGVYPDSTSSCCRNAKPTRNDYYYGAPATEINSTSDPIYSLLLTIHS